MRKLGKICHLKVKYTFEVIAVFQHTAFIFIESFFLCFSRMSVTIVYYGLSLNTSNLNGNIYLNCFISAAIDIVAYVATWLLVNRTPRPSLLFSTLLFCGILLLIIQLVPEGLYTQSTILTESGIS